MFFIHYFLFLYRIYSFANRSFNRLYSYFDILIFILRTTFFSIFAWFSLMELLPSTWYISFVTLIEYICCSCVYMSTQKIIKICLYLIHFLFIENSYTCLFRIGKPRMIYFLKKTRKNRQLYKCHIFNKSRIKSGNCETV